MSHQLTSGARPIMTLTGSGWVVKELWAKTGAGGVIRLTQAQIDSPTPEMLELIFDTFQLEVAPFTRYRSNGTAFVSLEGGGGGASLTNITEAALSALTAGTANPTTLYRVTDGTYRDTVYLYDTTSDTFHPIGIPPSAFGFA